MRTLTPVVPVVNQRPIGGEGDSVQDLTGKAKQEQNWLMCNPAAHTDRGPPSQAGVSIQY